MLNLETLATVLFVLISFKLSRGIADQDGTLQDYYFARFTYGLDHPIIAGKALHKNTLHGQHHPQYHPFGSNWLPPGSDIIGIA